MNHLLLIFIFLFTSLFVYGQKSDIEHPKDFKPKSVKEALNYLESTLTKDKILEFKDKSEDDAVYSNYRFGIGLFMRNSWIRHGNPKLKKFFYRNKVYNIETMSVIILKAFHRKLNNKKNYLKPLLKPHKVKWERGKEGRIIYKDSIDNLLKSFKVNDTITFKYYYTVVGHTPEEMELYKKCQPKAIVLKRNIRKRRLYVKLISACKNNGIRTDFERGKGTKPINLNETGWTNYYEWEQ